MGDLSANFSTREFACPCCKVSLMTLMFVERLQAARNRYGRTMYISSGYRCREHNAAVGGVEGSAHMLGMAADIRCLIGQNRFELLQALLGAGFTRIGISSQFIHVDIDKSKPDNVIWTY
jgi:uncharacterized protein YcbK (DUF882 family)